MCITRWCDGSCDECVADKKKEKEWEEANTECPYKKECVFETVTVKQDRCRTCGKITNYS